jgi:hypothetical protein
MRWRLEEEVLDERGERTCGNVRCEDHHPASQDEMDRWRRKKARKEREQSPRRSEGSGSRRRHSIDDRRRREEEDEDEEPLVPTDLTPYQRAFKALLESY